MGRMVVAAQYNFNPDMTTVNEETEETSSVPPRTVRQTSDVWNIFEKVEKMDGNIKLLKAKCGICGEFLSRGGTNGTTHLKRHIKKHASANCQNEDIRNQMQLAINVAGKVTNFQYDKNAARKEIVDFIIRAELLVHLLKSMIL
ncbi:hypothetical protein ACLB2K_034903 [Fragaria x ananassa]